MVFSRILFLLVGLLVVDVTLATTVLPVSLERMSKTAEYIFYGKALSNEVKFDAASNRVATFTIFEIIDNVKGDAGTSHTVKQVGGQLAGSAVVHRFHGVPRFTVGEEYVIFLPPQSRLGFSSPVGLSQGKFSVQKQKGIATVSNGRVIKNLTASQNNDNAGNTGTQTRSTPSSTRLSPIVDQPTKARLADFIQAVRDYSKE